jgi:hypothetical protein
MPSRSPPSPLRHAAAGALCLATLVGAPLVAHAQSRGELLYMTHCSACHSAQMHWREKKQVRDWPSLRAQVQFWQAQAVLGWNDEDIISVAQYLNQTYYRLPPASEPRVSSRWMSP